MLSLSEKWRPTNVDDLLGQPNIKLVFDLSTTYVAPAYLFYGPPGTGKTSSAKLLISHIENKDITELSKIKSDVIEYNCGMLGQVENIKELIIEKCSIPPRQLGRKYVILDEAQMLTNHAQNALLNIMESPPYYLTFISCTTDPKKILPAVKSRCMQIKFLPGAKTDLVKNLTRICGLENINFDTSGLEMLAVASNGSYRDSLMILDQIKSIGATENNVLAFAGVTPAKTIDSLLVSALCQDISQLMLLLDNVKKSNANITELIKLIYFRLVEILKIKAIGQSEDSELFSICKDKPVMKFCDLLNKSISELSPGTPEELLLQTTLLKLSFISTKNN